MARSKWTYGSLAVVLALGNFALAAGASRVSMHAGVMLPQAASVSGMSPGSMVRADLDRDGRDELIVAFNGPQGGAVAIYRQDGMGRYSSQVQVLALLDRPDFMAAIDADADGNLDLVTGTRGSAVLGVLLGDGRGWWQQARPVTLPGALNTMTAADVDRDGVGDLAVAIGPSVQLLMSTRGVMAAKAVEIINAGSAVNSLVFAQLDNAFPLDLALATDNSVSVLRGNEQYFVGAASSTLPLDAAVLSITAASFVPGRVAQLAVLDSNGIVRLIDARGGLREERRIAAGVTASRLVSGKYSSSDGSDLVILTSDTVRVIAGGAGFGSTTTELPQRGRPQDVLATPSTQGGLSDLVLALDGFGAPLLSAQGNDAAFTVTSTGDTPDAVINGVCDDGAGNCTLRAAIQEANAAGGADTITFSLGAGNPTITLTSAMVAIVDTVDINGNTGGSTRVEINGNLITQPPIFLAAGSSGSAIRGLVINRAGTTTTGAPGIRIESANNLVENCYIGTDNAGGSTVAQNRGGGIIITGSAATNNVIGGSTAAQRNLISRNSLDGVLIDAGASSNRVLGNYIGVDATGNVGAGNSRMGVNITGGAQNNRIGDDTATPGTAPGNVFAGNSTNGIAFNGTTVSGNTVRGNTMGLRADGTGTIFSSGDGVNMQTGTNNNTIGGSTSASRNVIGGQSSDGIEMNGASGLITNNVITGNYIGVGLDGATVRANSGNGILITGGGQNNRIGDDTATPGTAPGNVISGNSTDGIQLVSNSTSANKIVGNIIGLNAAGTVRTGNRNGVFINGAQRTQIGGSSALQRNIISGANGTGVEGSGIMLKTGSGATDTKIEGNYIGTDITGTIALFNVRNGIEISVSSGSTITGTFIGGLTATPGTPPGNVVSGNNTDGMFISGAAVSGVTIQGNIVGLNAAGNAVLKNSSNGIQLTSGTINNLIGGSTSQARNIISGNGSGGTSGFSSGLSINSSTTKTNTVQGNFIGTDITGTIAFSNGQHGVVIKGGSNGNTIGGLTATPGQAPGNLISGNTANTSATGISGSSGINIDGSGAANNVVQGNLIGTDITGTVALGNRRAGILISTGSANNTVGGSAAGARNVVSGNNASATSPGIEIYQSTNNRVQGNYVGVDITGNVRLANTGDGVLMTDAGGFTGATGNIVGGSGAGERNVVSGNSGVGVKSNGAFAGSETIQGNYIGVGADGATLIPNGSHGVQIISNSSNTIGGTTGITAGACTGACNNIYANAGAGIKIDSGTTNVIRGNSISDNSALGIDLGTAGVTPNDANDPDTGANNLQNFPVITAATYDCALGTLKVDGTLNTTPNRTGLVIELFSNAASDPSGNGQGRTYLGTITGINTDAGGNASWTITVTGQQNFLSTTATDANNTSEFSATFKPNYDQDTDGFVDCSDCAPLDPNAWALPNEVSGVNFSSASNLLWDSLALQAGPGTNYDVMRGSAAEFPVGSGGSEVCLANNAPGPTLSTAADPLAGESFYYLVRGRNVCAVGKYGRQSDGTPRVSSACP